MFTFGPSCYNILKQTWRFSINKKFAFKLSFVKKIYKKKKEGLELRNGAHGKRRWKEEGAMEVRFWPSTPLRRGCQRHQWLSTTSPWMVSWGSEAWYDQCWILARSAFDSTFPVIALSNLSLSQPMLHNHSTEAKQPTLGIQQGTLTSSNQHIYGKNPHSYIQSNVQDYMAKPNMRTTQ